MSAKKKMRNLISLLQFLSLPVYLYAASIATEEEICPVIDGHCDCSGGPYFTIKCTNISSYNVLYDVVGNFTEKTFSLELQSLHMTHIPVQALESPYLMSLIVANSDFDNLFNTSGSIVTNESSIVHYLSLENVTTKNEWNWNQLNTLKRLDILFAYNTTIGESLPSNFSKHVSKTLKFLSISQSNISSVGSLSFQELGNLTYLRISHSKLNTLTRDVLPSPSKLGQLRLDHNFITSLPDDMFQNMPNLTLISLSNNRISVLSEELFRPLWRPEVYLELRNNPIKCDCRMRWLVTSTVKPNIIGECSYPKRLFRKDIKNVTEQDLNC